MSSRSSARPPPSTSTLDLRGPRSMLIGVLAVVAVAAFSSLPRIGVPSAIVLGAAHAAAAVLLARRHVRGRALALVAALVLIGWSVGQVVLGDVTWIELVGLGAGAFEALLVSAVAPAATHTHGKRMRGRR